MSKRSPLQRRWSGSHEEMDAIAEELGDAGAVSIQQVAEEWKRRNPLRNALVSLPEETPKWQLYEAALHLAALATGEYDDAMKDGRAEARLEEELLCLGHRKHAKIWGLLQETGHE